MCLAQGTKNSEASKMLLNKTILKPVLKTLFSITSLFHDKRLNAQKID